MDNQTIPPPSGRLRVWGTTAEACTVLGMSRETLRSRNYALLDGVRQQGDWEAWIDVFLEGVENTAAAAVATAHRLLELVPACAWVMRPCAGGRPPAQSSSRS